MQPPAGEFAHHPFGKTAIGCDEGCGFARLLHLRPQGKRDGKRLLALVLRLDQRHIRKRQSAGLGRNALGASHPFMGCGCRTHGLLHQSRTMLKGGACLAKDRDRMRGLREAVGETHEKVMRMGGLAACEKMREALRIERGIKTRQHHTAPWQRRNGPNERCGGRHRAG